MAKFMKKNMRDKNSKASKMAKFTFVKIAENH